jgi:hypothetical protein
MGINHVMNMDDFNAIFGFDSSGHQEIPTEFRSSRAWYDLSGSSEFQPSVSKSTQMHSHAFRYVHRVLAHTILAREHSTGAVNQKELFFMWAMLTGQKVSGGFWLCKQFKHLADVNLGAITIGGLITAIAVHFGFNPATAVIKPVGGVVSIDFDTLMSMSLIVCHGGEYFLVDEFGEPIPKSGHVAPVIREIQGDAPQGVQMIDEDNNRDHDEMPNHPTIPIVPSITSDTILAKLIDQIERLESLVTSLKCSVNSVESSIASLDSFVRKEYHSLQGKLNKILGEEEPPNSTSAEL